MPSASAIPSMANSVQNAIDSIVSGQRIDGSFVSGQRIALRDLQARPDLNGQYGTIVEWDPSENRWKVHMDDGSYKSFNPWNLMRSTMSAEDAPDAMGVTSDVQSGSSGQDTSLVMRPASAVSSMPAAVESSIEECRFASGQRIALRDLKARPDLNGQHGTIVEWDPSESRWKVQMDDGSHKSFNPWNIMRSTETARNSLDAMVAASGVLTGASDQENMPSSLEGGSASDTASRSSRSGPGSLTLRSATQIMHSSADDQAVEPNMLSTSTLRDRLFISDDARTQRWSGMPVEQRFKAGMHVCIHDHSDPGLNGSYGVLIAQHENKDEWMVRMSDSTGMLFPSANLDFVAVQADQEIRQTIVPAAEFAGLEMGMEVTLNSLQARPELNGQSGVLEAWNSDEERWLLKMHDGTGKMLKPCNLHVRNPAKSLKLGRRVRIHSWMERPELNETQGILEAWVPSQAWWMVSMLPDGAGIMVSPRNLEVLDIETAPMMKRLAPGVRAHVRAYDNMPDSAAQIVTILGWDGVSSRWRVQMCEAKEGSPAIQGLFKADVLEPLDYPLSSGMTVFIAGLKSQVEMNGQSCEIIEFDEESSRWKVQLEDGSGKLLKPENVCIKSGYRCEDAAGGNRLVPSSGELSPGMRVCIHGLLINKSTNGECGTTSSWDAEEQRWRVNMDNGARKAFKTANLRLLPQSQQFQTSVASAMVMPRSSEFSPGMEVCIIGLQNRPELNEQMGVIVTWDPQEFRWKVRMHNGEGIMARTVNLSQIAGREAITPGQKVRAVGLVQNPSINGQTGVAIKWDEGQCRWQVLMDDNTRRLFEVSKLETVTRPFLRPTPSSPIADPRQDVTANGEIASDE